MSTPYLSVIVPTMRVGGVDVLSAGLRHQTFADFELVLVDCVGPREAVRHLQLPSGSSLCYCTADPNPFPRSAFSACANAGLVAARGEVAILLCDYTWLPPDCLAKHAEFHRTHESEDALMGPHRYVKLPYLRPEFGRPYAYDDPAETERYAADVAAGRLDGCMWSIFAGSPDFAALPEDDYTDKWIGRDPKLDMPAGPIDPLCFHGKNESIRLEKLLYVNGWDEAMDGTHGWQDSDLAERLTWQAGVRWTLDPTNVVNIVNPRRVFPFARREHPIDRNREYWEQRRAAGYPENVNDYSLRDRRR